MVQLCLRSNQSTHQPLCQLFAAAASQEARHWAPPHHSQPSEATSLSPDPHLVSAKLGPQAQPAATCQSRSRRRRIGLRHATPWLLGLSQSLEGSGSERATAVLRLRTLLRHGNPGVEVVRELRLHRVLSDACEAELLQHRAQGQVYEAPCRAVHHPAGAKAIATSRTTAESCDI